jgi:hypothetical protein
LASLKPDLVERDALVVAGTEVGVEMAEVGCVAPHLEVAVAEPLKLGHRGIAAGHEAVQ